MLRQETSAITANIASIRPNPSSTLRRMVKRCGAKREEGIWDVAEEVGESPLPTSRIAKESGYICYHLVADSWRKKRTQDPGQPEEGFTISATEDHAQADLLCDAYLKSDRDGRRMIQLFAQLSIVEGEGIAPGRFMP